MKSKESFATFDCQSFFQLRQAQTVSWYKTKGLWIRKRVFVLVLSWFLSTFFFCKLLRKHMRILTRYLEFVLIYKHVILKYKTNFELKLLWICVLRTYIVARIWKDGYLCFVVHYLRFLSPVNYLRFISTNNLKVTADLTPLNARGV